MGDKLVIFGSHIVPCDVDQFYNVTKLHVNNGYKVNLPKEIFNMNLIILDLCNNMIKTLPKEFSNFKNLMLLDISHNDFDVMPTVVSNMNLILITEGNRIAKFHKSAKFPRVKGIPYYSPAWDF